MEPTPRCSLRRRRALDEQPERRASKRAFLGRLCEAFSPAEAERQLATAVDWARYGEAFYFDADTEEFFLPPSE